MKLNESNRRPWSQTLLVILLVALLSGSVPRAACGSVTVTMGVCIATVGQQEIDPAKIVGRESCRECHQAEFSAWEASAHGKNAWNLLGHPKAPDIAKEMGIAEADIKTSMCTNCHGTAQKAGGVLKFAHGNSCESCHGAAGGASGWLEKHYDFGTDSKTMAALLKDRMNETAAASEARRAACKEAGMNRAEDVVAVAKNCLLCHTVPNEKLIDAGHPTSDKFEFVEWAQGEVRHNFLLDRSKNAEVSSVWMEQGSNRTAEGRLRLMYIAGQLADLEVSLRTRSEVASVKRNTLGDAANDRIQDAIKELEKVASIAELKPVLAALAANKIERKTLRETTAGDKTLYGSVADIVAKAAEEFVMAHQDGNKLPGVKLPKKSQGDVFKVN